jgi:hypothetical protein
VPQTVFDVGDLITSRLNLGVIPDGSTAATVAVYRPDGVALAGLATTAWVGMEKTTQWRATDDGSTSGTLLHAAGDWLAVWTVTGTGESISAKVYNVRPLPTAWEGRPAWTPFLSDVADYVPYLTVSAVTPGSQVYLGTFTGDTNPSDEQVQRIVDREVTLLTTATVGTTGMPSAMYATARAVAALRAASVLSRTYPRHDNIDLRFASNLDALADAAFAQLVAAIGELGGGTGSGPAPVGYYPDPVSWGDWYL